MALICILKSFIELEYSLVFRVDGVICKMHEKIGEVLFGWRLVLVCAESCQPFLEKVYAKRIDREYENI